jgi:hypothetical protein
MKRFCRTGAYVIAVTLTALFLWATPQTIHSQTPPTPAQNPDWQKLQDRVEQLEKELADLKKEMKPAPPAIAERTDVAVGETVASVSAPASAPKPPDDQDKKGESTFQIYGFAMLDAGYQFKQNNPNWFDVVRPTQLPSFGGEFAPNGKVYYGVRQSRFGVKSSTPTKYGELKTQFEFELFGTGVDAGQTTFRLRHAYGELGQFGAGQTWSPFMDIDVFPNSLEYWGPNGMVFFRNVQVRWMPLKGRNSVTIALERPGASADQGQFSDRIELSDIRPKFDLPDLSGNVRFTRDWGYVQIAGMLRRIKWIDNLDDAVDLNGSAIGAGLNVSSNLKFTPNDTGKFSVIYGTGVENYMNDAPVDVGIERNPGDPTRPIKGVALPVLGLVAFLDHNWNKKFSTSVGYSMVNIQNSDGQLPNAYHRGHYGLANLLFYPVENAMVGGEFQWGRRQNVGDGFHSDDFRIQISFRYNFSKTFTF